MADPRQRPRRGLGAHGPTSKRDLGTLRRPHHHRNRAPTISFCGQSWHQTVVMSLATRISRLMGCLVLLTWLAGGQSKPASNTSKQQAVLADRATQKPSYIQR